jgi:hypothetical protein
MRSSHGDAAEMRAFDRQRVHQRDHIVGQRRERVFPRGRVGAAVATLVITQDAEFVLQRRRLIVPHRQIGDQRIGEDDPRRAFRPVDLIVEADAVGVDFHEITFGVRGAHSDFACPGRGAA